MLYFTHSIYFLIPHLLQIMMHIVNSGSLTSYYTTYVMFQCSAKVRHGKDVDGWQADIEIYSLDCPTWLLISAGFSEILAEGVILPGLLNKIQEKS